MPISADEHNNRRREAKRKQNAVARAKATHSRKEDDRGDFDFVFNGQIETDLVGYCLDNGLEYINTRGLTRLVKEGKLLIKINEGEPVIGGTLIKPTFKGFKTVDDKNPGIKIRKILVSTAPPLSVTFFYGGPRGYPPKMQVS